MYDLDDPKLRQRIAAQFAQGTLVNNEELFTLTQTYTLHELGLIVMTYHNEALAFLLDADGAWQCMMALIANINRHVSEENRSIFNVTLTDTMDGVTAHDEEISSRLPTFDYVPRGNRAGIHITFPIDTAMSRARH